MVAEYGAWSSNPTHIEASVHVQYVGLLCTFGLYCMFMYNWGILAIVFTQNMPILCMDVMPISRIYARIRTEIPKNFCT